MFTRQKSYLLSMILMLAMSSAVAAQFERLPTTSPGPDAAVVVGTPGARASDLFEVRFTAINGRQISPREALWLEPGTYELTVSIIADFRASAPLSLRRRQSTTQNTIELELEAGKTYHVLGRFLRAGENAGNYSVILHRVEE